MIPRKPRIAIHKFTSCDGCQLAFLHLGEDLLELAEKVDIVHFVEMGPINPLAEVDVAYIEGSISTPDEKERIQHIRANSRYVITIGACATSGGIQALRNFANTKEWMKAIYATPDTIATLETSTAISAHIKVDFEIYGCPVNSQQILASLLSVLHQTTPTASRDKVCLECKRLGYACVMVTKGEPCMGPVTQTGCGALCPSLGRGCYACYGPAENTNTASLTKWLSSLGLSDEEIARRFLFIQNNAPAFKKEGLKLQGKNKHD